MAASRPMASSTGSPAAPSGVPSGLGVDGVEQLVSEIGGGKVDFFQHAVHEGAESGPGWHSREQVTGPPTTPACRLLRPRYHSRPLGSPGDWGDRQGGGLVGRPGGFGLTTDQHRRAHRTVGFGGDAGVRAASPPEVQVTVERSGPQVQPRLVGRRPGWTAEGDCPSSARY